MALSNILLASSAEGGCPDLPSNNKTVEAITYEGKIFFPSKNAKLRNSSEALYVGYISMKISMHKIESSRTDLSGIELFFLPYAPNH